MELSLAQRLKEKEKRMLARGKKLPKEVNGCCPNYYNPDHDPENCPGVCRNCIWDSDE